MVNTTFFYTLLFSTNVQECIKSKTRLVSILFWLEPISTPLSLFHSHKGGVDEAPCKCGRRANYSCRVPAPEQRRRRCGTLQSVTVIIRFFFNCFHFRSTKKTRPFSSPVISTSSNPTVATYVCECVCHVDYHKLLRADTISKKWNLKVNI